MFTFSGHFSEASCCGFEVSSRYIYFISIFILQSDKITTQRKGTNINEFSAVIETLQTTYLHCAGRK